MRIQALVAALLIVLFGSTPAAASSTTSMESLSTALGNADWGGAEAIAKELDARSGRGDILSAYVKAHELASSGNCPSALTILDLLIASEPYFLPAQELAYVCQRQLGDHRGAVSRLEAMLALLPPGPQRDIVLQLKQNEEAETRPVFNIFGDVAPTTNAERQTAATTLGPFTINENSRGHAGVLASVGASMAYKLFSGPGFFLTGVLRTDVRYSTATQQFEPRLTAELPATFSNVGNARVLVVPFATAGFANLTYAYAEAGGRGVVSQDVGTSLNVALSGSAALRKYEFQPYRDGIEVTGAIAASYLFDPQTLLTTTLAGEYDHTLDATRRTLDLSLTARLDHIMDSGIVTAVQATLGRRWHADPPPLSAGPNQIDTYVSGRVELAYRGFTLGPFMPTLYYQYTKQWSDNVFYDYQSHDAGISLRAKL